jgi:hypothetical protein
MGRQPTEKRRAQHNAGKHLTHDARLVYFPEQLADQTAHCENDRNLQNERKEIRHQCAPPAELLVCLVA